MFGLFLPPHISEEQHNQASHCTQCMQNCTLYRCNCVITFENLKPDTCLTQISCKMLLRFHALFNLLLTAMMFPSKKKKKESLYILWCFVNRCVETDTNAARIIGSILCNCQSYGLVLVLYVTPVSTLLHSYLKCHLV